MKYLNSKNLSETLDLCSRNPSFVSCVVFKEPEDLSLFLTEVSSYAESIGAEFDYGELRFIFKNGSILYGRTARIFNPKKDLYNEVILDSSINLIDAERYMDNEVVYSTGQCLVNFKNRSVNNTSFF